MCAESSNAETPAVSDKVIEILRRACRKPKGRAEAIRDPRGLLARHGVELGPDQEVRVYERADVRKGGKDGEPDPASPVLARSLARTTESDHTVPAWFEAAWRRMHGGCPPGTAPYTTTSFVSVCDVWVVVLTGKEWVQDVEGTAWGHWEYSGKFSRCVRSRYEAKVVTECLPLIQEEEESEP